MALDKQTLEEIKAYMDDRADAWKSQIKDDVRSDFKSYLDDRAESWQASSISAASREFREEKERQDSRFSRLLTIGATVAGFSLAGLGTFAYSGVVGTAERVALKRTNDVLDGRKESEAERSERLEHESNILAGQIAEIVNAKLSVAEALREAKKAEEEAKAALTSTQNARDELRSAIESAKTSTENANIALNALENARASAESEVKITRNELIEAQKKRSELEKLSSDVERVKSLANQLVGAEGSVTSIVSATLQNKDVRQEIIAAAAFPEGAVVAFLRDEFGSQVCPDEWTYFRPAEGRFLLGASELKYRLGDTGGDEMVTLTVAQMPRHDHAATSVPDVNAPGSNGFLVRGFGGFRLPDSQVSEAGGSQPHNNMPPYIALYFCKKD